MSALLSYLRKATDFLSDKGVDNPRLDAEVLLADILGLDRVGLYLNFDRPLDEGEVARYRAVVQRRGRREPLQYVRGRQEFYGRDFSIDRAVLVPRADTETVIAEALASAAGGPAARILDVGCGSGVIAVTLALELPGARVIGTDVSPEAVATARTNAERLGAARVEIREGDLFGPVAGEVFDLVVSNPPYCEASTFDGLAPEVRDFEPRLALDGGADGLAVYRRLAGAVDGVLAPGGTVVLEIGLGQRASVEPLFAEQGLRLRNVRTDLAGIERALRFDRGEA